MAGIEFQKCSIEAKVVFEECGKSISSLNKKQNREAKKSAENQTKTKKEKKQTEANAEKQRKRLIKFYKVNN